MTWAKEHPEVVILVLTAIFNLLFKPRTPEEYATIANKSPRLAEFLRLLPAIFPDPIKIVETLTNIVVGKPKP